MKQQQAELFLWFVAFGFLCGLIYDVLLTLRSEVRHGTAVIMLEDILYAAAACTGGYAIFFRKNNGALRMYGFLGIFCGAALYVLAVSPWLRVGMKWCLKILLFPVKWLYKKCKKWKLGRKALTNRS